MNELEGFLAENITESDLEKILNDDICKHLGDIKSDCEDLVKRTPEIVCLEV